MNDTDKEKQLSEMSILQEAYEATLASARKNEDAEGSHGNEDLFYRWVLEAIADNKVDPVQAAQLALRLSQELNVIFGSNHWRWYA